MRNAWQRFSRIRGEYQPEAHRNMTSGHRPCELGGDGGLKPKASESLLNEDTELTGKSATVKKNTAARNLGSLGEIANKAKEAEANALRMDENVDPARGNYGETVDFSGMAWHDIVKLLLKRQWIMLDL